MAKSRQTTAFCRAILALQCPQRVGTASPGNVKAAVEFAIGSPFR